MKVDTVDIRDIRDSIERLNMHTANLIGRFDSHIDNKAIHQNPPCKAHLALAGRLWGVCILATGGLITAVWSVFNKGQ